MLDFCTIQIEILKEREEKLRREILDCKIQKEFLTEMLQELTKDRNKYA